MKHLYFLLTVILLMTCTVKAQSQSDYKEFENCVLVDGLGYSLNETTKEAAVVPHYATDKDGNELSEGYKGDVVVPESITVDGIDYKVTELEEMAFGMSDITSLKLPSTIRKMGFRSVDYCPELVKANLPASVEDIGERPFCSCPKLDDFTIEEGNKNYILESNMLMTADKTTLLHLFGESDKDKPVSVTVPSTVKTIRACALSLCEGVNEITLPEGLDSIGYMAFSCTSITTITIPSTVTHISGGFVLLSKNLREIIVSEGNRNYKIEGGAMYDTDKTMLYWVSPACTSLAIPETVTKVCEGAIEYTALKALVIPKSVKEISSFAVTNNQQLKTLVIGSGLELIESFTFWNNLALRSVFVRGNKPATLEGDAFYSGDAEENVTLYVPEGSKQLYATAPCWEDFKNIKEYSLEGIDRHPGYASEESVAVDGIAYDLNRENMTATVVSDCYWDADDNEIELCPTYSGNIVIPEEITVDGVDYTVTEIGKWTFMCRALESLSLPSTLKTIQGTAFAFVEGLKTLKIPASVENIIPCIFAFCDDLETLEIEEGNKNYVFEDRFLMTADRTRLISAIGLANIGKQENVVVPSTVKSIEYGAMYGAYGMANITLPEGLETIGTSAFSCSGITSLHIPASVTTIEDGFLTYADKLKEVTVAEGNANYTVKNGMLLTKDLTELLEIPSLLDSYEIPETVTCIYYGAADCLNTNSIVIPDGVKILDEWAFVSNDALETVVVGSSVETWGDGAFYNCKNLKSIYLRSEKVVTPEGEPFDDGIYETAKLYVPEGTYSAYELDSYWGRFWNIEEFSITDIKSAVVDTDNGKRIYDLLGRRRNERTKGLVIVNGKKAFRN